ncbi:hypothetical protein HNQ57_003308 [Zhongshania antarctica]|uniref:Transposase n=1 Tax=Zhongshania antarctica TaxID=641702 RepID=A0A840R6S4_9GAMM|nr:transposase [Zhongshania antarctica]MBB5189009.1 hypothetical protein [Zhongshania antarctica]
MVQKRSYKQYSKEFKEEAVALIRDQSYSVAEASKSLGVASNMLYRWKKINKSNCRQVRKQWDGLLLTLAIRRRCAKMVSVNLVVFMSLLEC